MNLTASKLAGLHVYFFLAAARAAKPKDMGAFITASEWLDVNYGALVRSLIRDLLAAKHHRHRPKGTTFPDAATAAIATFEIGAAKSVYFKRVDKLSAGDRAKVAECIVTDSLRKGGGRT